jgi:hypothetical protein
VNNRGAQCDGEFVGLIRRLVINTSFTTPCTPGVHPYKDLVSVGAGERGHDFPGPTAHQIFLTFSDNLGISSSRISC